ncbi:MAG: transposase, partial [Bacteroidota bacterium]
LIKWVKKTLGWVLEIVVRTDKQKQFEVLPKRWVVERTFAWFESYRRLSRDYEYSPNTHEMMVYLATIKLILNRMARKNPSNESNMFQSAK